MTAIEGHTPVGFRTSFVQQLRLLAWSKRWLFLILGLLLPLGLVWATNMHARLGLPPILVAAMLGLPAPALWALAIWHGELPDRRSYHWSLPVSRPGHDLARIAAGAVWLMAAYLVLAACDVITAVAGVHSASFAELELAWTTFFAGPLVLYLMISPFALWSDTPWLRRGVMALVCLGMLGTILELEGFREAMAALFGQDGGIATVLFVRPAEVDATGPLGQNGATVLWLGIGLAITIVTATWRPAEIGRLMRRDGAKAR